MYIGTDDSFGQGNIFDGKGIVYGCSGTDNSIPADFNGKFFISGINGKCDYRRQEYRKDKG